jgi:hypothetical protein
MRKFLRSLSDAGLKRIAGDIGSPAQAATRDGVIDALVEYFLSYQISVADVKSRWRNVS